MKLKLFRTHQEKKQDDEEEEDVEVLRAKDPEAYYERLLNDNRTQQELPIKRPVLNFKKGWI